MFGRSLASVVFKEQTGQSEVAVAFDPETQNAVGM